MRAENASVVFQSDMAGELNIPVAKIRELHTRSNFAVLTKDQAKKYKTVPTGVIDIGPDAIRIYAPAAAQDTVPIQQIAYIIPEATYQKEISGHPGFFSGWNGTVTAGATLVRATQSGETFTLASSLLRAIPDVAYLPKRNRTTFNVSETYGKLSQPATPPSTPSSYVLTSIFHTDAERDEYFTERFYALADTSFDHNNTQGLSLQEVYGGGLGWTPIKDSKQQLDVRADVHYEKQQFQAPPGNTNLIGSTLAETYVRHLPKNVVFNEYASFLPAFNDPKAYSANATGSLLLPVFHRLSANLTATDNFLNNPTPGFQKNSFQFVTGISYSLH